MEELVYDIGRLFENPKNSDLTLVSSGNSYPAHRAIVCARSSVIERACEFKASQGGNAEKKFEFTDDDDPQAVDCLIQYIYCVDYNKRPGIAGNVCGIIDEDKEPATEAVDGDGSDLVLHAKVYALAEKYGVIPLKKLAVSKFEAAASSSWGTTGFLRAAQEAYTSTISEDRRMRDAVVKIFNVHRSEFRQILRGNEYGQKVLSDTKDLATDIYMSEHDPPLPPGLFSKKRMQRVL